MCVLLEYDETSLLQENGERFETYENPIRNTIIRPCFFFLSIFKLAMMGKGKTKMAKSTTKIQTPTATVTGAPVAHLAMSLLSQTSCPCGTQSTAKSPACVIEPMDSKIRSTKQAIRTHRRLPKIRRKNVKMDAFASQLPAAPKNWDTTCLYENNNH